MQKMIGRCQTPDCGRIAARMVIRSRDVGLEWMCTKCSKAHHFFYHFSPQFQQEAERMEQAQHEAMDHYYTDTSAAPPLEKRNWLFNFLSGMKLRISK